MVCARSQQQAKAPDRRDIEGRLYQEQLSMLSRRYLRDLRNSATIETP
jgi:peptidyl-prolyl cis-trans isomerase SurA